MRLLALVLSHEISKWHCHYGTFTVDSPRGQGVQVTLALPIEDEDLFMRREMPDLLGNLS